MTPAEVLAAKSKIDADLLGKSKNVGIAFGYEIFRAFVAAGYIRKQEFGALGTTLMLDIVPTYDTTHFAFVDWELSDTEFKVGA